MAFPDQQPSRRRVLKAGVGVAAFAFLGAACASDDEPADEESIPMGTETGKVPEPAAMVRSSWSTDPWALGAYSYLPVGAAPQLRGSLAEPVGEVLWFAGEATSSDAPSTVHGAQASGADAAAALIAATPSPVDVVVIGAGVSGARAARDLAAAGHRVVVVEARDRTGGRIHTQRPKGWPVPVEVGASWVHDTAASDVADQLQALEVSTVGFAYDDVILTADGDRSSADQFGAAPADAVAEAITWADGQEEDLSLEAAIDESGAVDTVDAVALDHYLRSEIATEYGADADELSAWWGLAEGSEGDDVLVTGGYGALVDTDLADLDVRLGWAADTVAIAGEGVSITNTAGEVLRAARAVVTVPLGVLQEGTITFDPPLPPAKLQAIATLGMGLLDKVWLRWDEPWWSEAAEQWTLVADADEPYVEWFNLFPATGEAVLLGLVGGSMARTWAERSDDEVLAAAVGSLQAFASAGW